MNQQNTYDIKVIVKEVEVRGEMQPRVFFHCKCGNNNFAYDDRNPESFIDFLRQTNITPDPENYPHRTKLVRYKVLLCKKCKADIPHGMISAEIHKQITILKAKKNNNEVQ